MFKDLTTAKFKAGKGGDGLVSFTSRNAKKLSDGGVGGPGGDFYVEGTTNLYDLNFIKRDEVFKAEDGQVGGTNNSTGRNGIDYIFKVPLATNIYNFNGDLVCRIDQPNQRVKLLEGGKGGKGNLSFKSGGLDALYEHTEGEPGQELEVRIELELMGEVIFIGLPNAGKSSILNEITNANAKVAPYAFTTTIPQLGRLDDISLMDLPGLIEKTFEGKGLGTQFVRHTKFAKLVLHFLSLENPDLLEAYNTIRTEVKNIDPRLAFLPELVVLSKTDVFDDPKLLKKAEALFKKKKIKTVSVSIADDDSLETLKKTIKEILRP